MFKRKLSAIPFEVIVTANMVANVESEVNSMISENAFIDYLHISHLLATQHNVLRYNKNRSNGFTIVTKEEDGKYSYQVAVCNKTDMFDRRKGRYFALVRAQKHGWVEVPEYALPHTTSDHYSKQLAVVNYFIRTVHNALEPVLVPVKDSPVKIDLKTITKKSVAVFEDIALGTIGAGFKVKYSTNKHTGKVLALFEADVLATGDVEPYEARLAIAKASPIASISATKFGAMNKWYDRYHALYELLQLMTKQSEAQ